MKQPRLTREARSINAAINAAYASRVAANVFHYMKDINQIPVRVLTHDYQTGFCAWRFTCYRPGEKPT